MTDNSPVHSSDPLSTLLRAPGNVMRIVVLVLASAALVLPGFETHLGNITNVSSLLDAVPLSLSWLFPLLVAVALIMTAIPGLARYVRLADLVVAVAGLAFTVLAFSVLARLQGDVRSSEQLLGRYNADGLWSAAFQPGAYALMAATALAVVLLITGGRRSRQAPVTAR
jgi:hypothetical protein